MSGREIRIDVDLSIDRSTAPQQFPATQNVPYSNFTIIDMTPGATFQLGAGQGADLFPYGLGDGWGIDELRCEPPVTDGLFIKNAPQPGATLMLQVGIASQRAGGNN
jgi:hypothetical protein